MNLRFGFLLLVLCTALAGGVESGPAEHNRLTPEEAAAGWRLLFDGRDTSHWRAGVGEPFPEDRWTVEDGCLRPREEGRGGSLYSAETYNNFEFSFDWKIPKGGNTGVKYFCVPGRLDPDFAASFQKRLRLAVAGLAAAAILLMMIVLRRGIFRRRRPFLAGLGIFGACFILLGAEMRQLHGQYQRALRRPPGHEYQIIDEKLAKGVNGDPRRFTAALYDLISAPDAVPNPPGEWNHGLIRVQGRQVEHWLNGRKVLEYEAGSDAVLHAVANSKFRSVGGFGEKASGLLMLQNHGSLAWFRNLKVRTLGE